MRATTALLVLQSVLLHAQGPDLVGYWQNWQDASSPYIALDQVDARYTVIEVSFALPQAGTSYDMQFTPDQTDSGTLQAQVATLQAQGRKVLISVGGAYIDLLLNTNAQRDIFVSSVMGIIDTYGFDGLDLDLESNSAIISGGTIADPVDGTIIRMIQAVRSIMTQYRTTYNRKMWLTMAPETYAVQGGQSGFIDGWGGQLPIVDALRDSLDILQVQYYNSGTMYGLDGAIYTQGTADFIVAETEAVCHGFQTDGGWFAPLPPEKIAIGLPACPGASEGYVTSADLSAAVRYLRGEGPQPGSYATLGTYPGLRGLMTWSINWDGQSACNTPGTFADVYETLFPSGSGVAEEAMEGGLASPNPVTAGEVFRVTGLAANEEFELLDATGARAVALKARADGIRVPSGLAPGIYLLRERDGTGRRVARINVQRD